MLAVLLAATVGSHHSVLCGTVKQPKKGSNILNLHLGKERTFNYPVEVFDAERLHEKTYEQKKTRDPGARWQRSIRVLNETKISLSMACYLYYCITVEIPISVVVVIAEELFELVDEYQMLSSCLSTMMWTTLFLVLYEKIREYCISEEKDKNAPKYQDYAREDPHPRARYPRLEPISRLRQLKKRWPASW